MDFEFNELQTSVQKMIKDFVEREIKPVAMEYELEDRYPSGIVEKMQELGFFGLTIPEEYGGGGMDEVCYAIAMEELSVGWMSVAGILGTHMMTSWMILHYGTDEQKKNYYALERRMNLLKILEKEHPEVKIVHGDCEKKLVFEN